MNEFESIEKENEESVSDSGSVEETLSAEETSFGENTENVLDDNEISVVGIAPGTAKSAKPKKQRPAIATIYDYAETFCYALATMMILFLFVFRYVSVDGDSMKYTLHHEDKLIISNLFYTPETGDIVVINPENHDGNAEPIIKRVIATEGQTVLIDYKNWAVYVDGVKLDEPYIEEARKAAIQETHNLYVSMNVSNVSKYMETFTVGEGKVFVMGDNRNHSRDSRDAAYGEMGVNRILGRVIIRISPDFGFVD